MSSLEKFYGEFQPTDNTKIPEEFYKQIEGFMSSTKHFTLNMNTEIANPALHAYWDLLAVYLGDIGCKDAKRYMMKYSKDIKEMNVGYKREGRRELKEILTSGFQMFANRFRDLGDRLLSRGKTE